MSRHPVFSAAISRSSETAEEYVHFVATNATPKAMTLSEIVATTASDAELQAAMLCLRNNQWQVRHELTSTTDGILLRGNRIVIPKELQERAISLAHTGHQGLVKTKSLLRTKVWFPGIDKQVESVIEHCLACQATTLTSSPEPLKPTKLPDYPWQKVSIDFCRPFASGDYLLVVIDDYSRFPEVEIIRTTSARVTISRLDKIFAVHGIPE